MLLDALAEIGTMTTKRETIAYISERHYFHIVAEDLEPYPSALYPEPRWHVLIAWARKDCVQHDWMFRHDQNDCWQITRDGLSVLSKAVQRFRDDTWDVRRCYVWTEALKRHVLPTYEPNSNDRPRPRTLYRDIDRQIRTDLFAGFGA